MDDIIYYDLKDQEKKIGRFREYFEAELDDLDSRTAKLERRMNESENRISIIEILFEKDWKKTRRAH